MSHRLLVGLCSALLDLIVEVDGALVGKRSSTTSCSDVPTELKCARVSIIENLNHPGKLGMDRKSSLWLMAC